MDLEPKLVYRALVKISHYTVHGFYDEVHIKGAENVPKDGPLVIASTHHNEIIDIATLSITIPHARHLSFWAKSSLFSNPLAGAILRSSGAIPVYRNPNNTNTNTNAGASTPGGTQESLFRSTTHALARGEAVGVFPEGTSYTEPGIVQVKDGAAWAAVEYVKANKRAAESKEESGENRHAELVVVPVAIVYTDKMRYRSKIIVHYGTPIRVPSLAGDPRGAVKKLTAEIGRALVGMSVNAPDWDTLNAAKMAREILWEEGELTMDEWVGVMQTLIALLTPTPTRPLPASLLATKRALVAYFALLHYTGTEHASLVYLLPSPLPSPPLTPPQTPLATPRILLPLLRLLHPRTVLFLPPLVTFAPGYALAALGGRVLAVGSAAPPSSKPDAEAESTPKTDVGGAEFGAKEDKGKRGKTQDRSEKAEEEEGKAQAKAVPGGIGIGIGCFVAGRVVLNALLQFGASGSQAHPGSVFVNNLVRSVVGSLGLGEWEGRVTGVLGGVGQAVDVVHAVGAFLGGTGARRMAGRLGVVYATGWVFVKWHNALVDWNYKTLRLLLTSYKLLSALLSRSSLSLDSLAAYTVPPRPAVNPYIKRAEQPESYLNFAAPSDPDDTTLPSPSPRKSKPTPIPARKLMRHLLRARGDATAALRAYTREVWEQGGDGAGLVGYLRERQVGKGGIWG